MASNCQIPTPTEYVKKMLDYAGYKKNLFGKKVLENSCGEGNILSEIVKRYVEDSIKMGYTIDEIIRGLEVDIEGFDVDQDKILKCIDKLNLLLLKYDIEGVKWNIHICDYLKTKKKVYDYIIGNPPYITYHDMDEEQRAYLKKHFVSCKAGRFDYCYAFIEKSLISLEKNGVLVYLVPYSILKNKFAMGLRNILLQHVYAIYDYKGIKIFPDAITSSIIIVCKNRNKGKNIRYISALEKRNIRLKRNSLKDKWTFGVTQSENKRKFGDYFEVCNSVATLLNDAFLLTNYVEMDNKILVNGYSLEKEFIYPAISTKSANISEKDEKKKTLIIFPYHIREGKIVRCSEVELKDDYPGIYTYLNSYREKLNERKKDQNAMWFEYGRSQAINRVFGQKLVLPMVITNSVKTHYGEENSIPYAGYFIKCRNGVELTLDYAKLILESRDFYDYVTMCGTPTTTTSYRISVDDIKEYRF